MQWISFPGQLFTRDVNPTCPLGWRCHPWPVLAKGSECWLKAVSASLALGTLGMFPALMGCVCVSVRPMCKGQESWAHTLCVVQSLALAFEICVSSISHRLCCPDSNQDPFPAFPGPLPTTLIEAVSLIQDNKPVVYKPQPL